MKNTPFENLAQMCNVSDTELKSVNKKRKRVHRCKQVSTHETSAITTAYNDGMARFNNISNVISIARLNNTTNREVIMGFCRERLDNHSASRVTDLILKSIS